MKKITTLFITMIMIVSFATINVFAVDNIFKKDGLTYTIIGENNVSVTAADLTQSEYNVPATIIHNNVEYTVVSLGERLFYVDGDNTVLTSITLPDTLKSIESAAFKDCKNLTSIALPDGITIIKDAAFEGCSDLKTIKFPSQLTDIRTGAFRDCSRLESIHIPDSVTRIQNNVFLNCRSLVSVVFPKNIQLLGGASFWYCNQLEEVTLPNGIETINKNTFQYDSNLSKVLIMTGAKDEVINDQILTAINTTTTNVGHPLQIYRGVAHIQAKQVAMTTTLNSTVNLNDYFKTSFAVYDESGQSSSVMTIPENYKNVEYQLVGQHSDKTQIIGNQLFISVEEKNQLQIEANLNGHTDNMSINIDRLDIMGIEIVQMPYKTTYTEGEIFDPAGLKVKVNYSNGSQKIVEYDNVSQSDFNFSIARPLTVTDKDILVQFAGQSIEFDITVLKKPIINDSQNNNSQNNDSQNSGSLEEQTQNQSQTPVTSDNTFVLGLSLLMMLSTAIIIISKKMRREN